MKKFHTTVPDGEVNCWRATEGVEGGWKKGLFSQTKNILSISSWDSLWVHRVWGSLLALTITAELNSVFLQLLGKSMCLCVGGRKRTNNKGSRTELCRINSLINHICTGHGHCLQRRLNSSGLGWQCGNWRKAPMQYYRETTA